MSGIQEDIGAVSTNYKTLKQKNEQDNIDQESEYLFLTKSIIPGLLQLPIHTLLARLALFAFQF